MELDMLLAGLAALAAVLVAGLRHVPEGTAFTLHRFGHYHRTLGPGWHLVVPLLDRIGKRIGLVGHQVEVHYPRDPVAADAAVYYQILEPKRTGAALEDVDDVVEREASERFADLARDAGTGSTDVAGLAGRLRDELNRRLAGLGLRVIRCQLHL